MCHPARRHSLSLSCESLSFCELAASGYYGNIFLIESHVSMPRKWKPPDDEYLKHLTEKDAVGLGIDHSLTGDQYKFHVRKGEKEEGDTELLRKLLIKFVVVLGFNAGIPGVKLSELHEELQRLQVKFGLALVHVSR